MLENSAAAEAAPALSHLLLQDKNRQVNKESMRWRLDSYPAYKGASVMTDNSIARLVL